MILSSFPFHSKICFQKQHFFEDQFFFVCVDKFQKKSGKCERNIFARFSFFVTFLKVVIFSTSISFVNVHFDAGPSK